MTTTATELCPKCGCYSYRHHFGMWICLECNHTEGQPPRIVTE